MHQYGLPEVEKLLQLPRSTIRAMMAAGFVTPQRGPRRSLLFSFQDLIVLRTAQALARAKVPPKRITRSLKALRRQLPESMPLSGLAIGAVGDRVVVRDGAGHRHVDSGQYLLSFEGDPQTGRLSVIEPAGATAAAADAASDGSFEEAVAREADDPRAAEALYERIIRQEPDRIDARVNLGRLLHERGDLRRAERVYRDALALGREDALLHYNHAVLLEDLGRRNEAVEAYRRALHADPGLADAHYNLALLCEDLQRPQDAIRHMSHYRRLAAED